MTTSANHCTNPATAGHIDHAFGDVCPQWETRKFQALADERAEAQIASVASQVPTATFYPLGGVSSVPLTARSNWRREIMAVYPTLKDVQFGHNRTVRAMHDNGVPFTLGHVTIHPVPCATCGDTDHDTAGHTSPLDYIPLEG